MSQHITNEIIRMVFEMKVCAIKIIFTFGLNVAKKMKDVSIVKLILRKLLLIFASSYAWLSFLTFASYD